MKSRVLIGLVSFGLTLSGFSQSSDKVLPAGKIITLIPNKIKEYSLTEDPKSKVIKIGTLQYSMAEGNFYASRKRSIKILLFDYKEASIMYSQATRKFSTVVPIESDTVTLRPIVMPGYTGWESYDVHLKHSQILLGIFNRYFLTIEGTNVDLETLQHVVHEFKFGDFPY
jgi:hypothetical protein